MELQLILLKQTSFFNLEVDTQNEILLIAMEKKEILNWEVLEPISNYCIKNNVGWAIISKKHHVSSIPFLAIQIELSND